MSSPVRIDLPSDLSELDQALEQIPNQSAVFLLSPSEGDPYLARTAQLRRRLLRLLREREKPSRLLNLRHTVRRIEYWLTGSMLEAGAVMYEQARRYYPETYLDLLKLRLPPYVKIILQNEFPRSQVTTQLTRSPAAFYGPFRNRSAAERFESQFLDLFQIRRCLDDLAPSPDHPGCMYGEMGMCLRPCQQVVGPDEYRHEVDRVLEFLHTDGRSLLDAIGRSRDRMSEELQFEEAARQHKRFEKVQEILRLRDELVRDIDLLNGVAITPSTAPNAVELWPVSTGRWQFPRRLTFDVEQGKPISLDQKLREVLGDFPTPQFTWRERQERLALLARWYYSSWRDGEWLALDHVADIPYRKLVHAVSRVAMEKTNKK